MRKLRGFFWGMIYKFKEEPRTKSGIFLKIGRLAGYNMRDIPLAKINPNDLKGIPQRYILAIQQASREENHEE